jgi:3-hydroxyacyl-[acyl-carrier-protein] dehydratase
MSEVRIEEIMQHLPHRYPMLLVDRVLEVIPGVSCRGLKNVTINEAFFQGHYPGAPVMPGVLIIEAIAQAGAILLLSDPVNKGKIPLIGSFDNVKFRKPVVPGDQLISDVRLVFYRSGVGKFAGEATVDGEVVASMECAFKLADGLKSG